MADLQSIHLDSSSDVPLYRQLAEKIESSITDGLLRPGDRLPPTRELAGQLGLNRTTVSAAYTLLEEAHLIQGQVGRGSFVSKRAQTRNQQPESLNWEAILPPLESAFGNAQPAGISFASSRPAQADFPVAIFRSLAKEVIESESASDILQLGSAHGYAPLRRYLMDEAIASRVARPSDGLLITNGCQQALDLLSRLFSAGSAVALEDPVYPGLLRAFSRAGADILPVPVEENGLNVDALEALLERRRPRLLVVTPSFQNPTGSTLSLDRRRRIVALANRFGCVLIENDIYSELRYSGEALPTLKELDESGNTVLLRSYSKVSFPGLRVGWVIAPRPVIARLAESKEVCDLHSDQLSQAVLLRFAESGELARHLERTRRTGAERLNAILRACRDFLPRGSRWTKPEGGMSLWVQLPVPLDVERLLARAQEAGVSFTPGRFFSTGAPHARELRLSFGGLAAADILRGMQLLGSVIASELTALRAAAAIPPANDFEPAAALV